MSRAQPEPAYYLVIPAAGAGRRMQQQLPKQYQLLSGKPVLQHTLERLSAMHPFARIVLAVAENDEYIDGLMGSLPTQLAARVELATGGAERADSVLSALHVLQQQAGEQDWVLVHDAVRPCLAADDLKRLVAQLQEEPAGGLLAVACRDTVKLAMPGGQVSETLDRSKLWLAATPQMFRFGVLYQALQQQLGAADSAAITDEAAAVEALQLPVKLVPCMHNNIKITYPEDLMLAECLLSARQV